MKRQKYRPKSVLFFYNFGGKRGNAIIWEVRNEFENWVTPDYRLQLQITTGGQPSINPACLKSQEA